jgi:membrane-anchored protein YejM (alkaline phosphatase superfamily)
VCLLLHLKSRGGALKKTKADLELEIMEWESTFCLLKDAVENLASKYDQAVQDCDNVFARLNYANGVRDCLMDTVVILREALGEDDNG